MWRTLLALLAVFVAALGLVVVTFSASAREQRADLVFVNGTEPKTLDPQKMTGVPEGRLADAVFEGLTYRDNDSHRPLPGSAASWDISPDGRRYTFHMRKEARWTDGKRVTAHDFAWSWKRLQEPETTSEYAYLLHCVRHAEAYNTFGAQVKALRGDPTAKERPGQLGILGGFRSLAGDGKTAVSAKDWQGFLSEFAVRDTVVRTRERALVDAIDTTTGELSADVLREVGVAFERDAARREAELADAKAHFGIDQGAFAQDEDTFVVELTAFVPYFLDLTSFHSALPSPRQAVVKNPESWFREPATCVSNGPFRLARWEVNKKIRLVKNHDYWGAREVALETVDALPIENSTTALNLYLSGEADWLPATYPPDLIDQLKDRPDFKANPSAITYFFRINVTRKPFDDPRVRLALSKAIDRDLLVTKVTRKGETPAVTIVPPMPGYTAPDSPMGYDPEGARKLLAEAGFPGGKGFPPFGVLYNKSEGHQKNAEFVADQLRRNLAVEAKAYVAEWQSYLRNQTQLDYDVCRAGWVADYRDPMTFLDLWITKGGNNNTGWGDPLYDRLIGLAGDPFALEAAADEVIPKLAEQDRAKALLAALAAAKTPAERVSAAEPLRMQLFREAEGLLVRRGHPFIPIYYYVVTNLVSPRVEGFRTELVQADGTKIPNLQDLHPLRDLRIRKD